MWFILYNIVLWYISVILRLPNTLLFLWGFFEILYGIQWDLMEFMILREIRVHLLTGILRLFYLFLPWVWGGLNILLFTPMGNLGTYLIQFWEILQLERFWGGTRTFDGYLWSHWNHKLKYYCDCFNQEIRGLHDYNCPDDNDD